MIESIVIGLGLFILSLVAPGFAFAAFMIIFPYKQMSMVRSTYFVDHQTYPNFMMAFCVICGFISTLTIKKKLSFSELISGYPKSGKIVWSLYALSFVSILWSLNAEIALEFWKTGWAYIAIFVLILPLTINSFSDLKLGVIGTIICTGLILTILVSTGTIIKGRAYEFAVSLDKEMTHGNPLAIAVASGYCLIAIVLLDLSKIGTFFQLLRFPIAGLMVYEMVRSGSRGEFIGSVLFLTLFLPLAKRIQRIKDFALIAGFLVILGILTFVLFKNVTANDVNSRWSLDAMTDAVKYGRVETSINLLKFWVNQGGLTYFFGIGNSGSFASEAIGQYPENVPAEVLAEEGIIGFILLVSIWYLGFKEGFALYRRFIDRSNERTMICILMAFLGYSILISFKAGNLCGNYFSFVFAIILGRLNRHVPNTIEDADDSSPRLNR